MSDNKLSLLDQIWLYQGVIFDMDGTLLNSEIWHHVSWRKAASMHGFPELTTELLISYGGLPSAEIVRRLNAKYGKNADVEQLAKDKGNIYIQECMSKVEPFPEICTILKDLKASGKRIAIATSTHLPEARYLLDKNQILPYVDSLITGDMVTRGKPNPDIYLLAAQSLKLPCEQCLIFEDTVVGLAGAKNANIDAVKVFEGKFEVDHIIHPQDHDLTNP